MAFIFFGEERSRFSDRLRVALGLRNGFDAFEACNALCVAPKLLLERRIRRTFQDRLELLALRLVFLRLACRTDFRSFGNFFCRLLHLVSSLLELVTSFGSFV